MNTKKRDGVIVFCTAAIIVLWIFMFFIYSFFSSRILAREEKNMVMSAQTMANSIEVIFNEQENLLDGYFNRHHIKIIEDGLEKNIQTMLRTGNEQTGDLSTDFLYLPAKYADELNFGGKLMDSPFQTMNQQEQVLERARTTDQTRLAAWCRNGDGNYILYLVKAVLLQEQCEGYIFEGVSLNEIYNIAMSEVDLRENSYCKIVDGSSQVLLHTYPEWIGRNLLDSMDQLSEAQREESRKVILEETSGKSGCRVNRTVWPDEPEGGDGEEIEAYMPMEIGNRQFYLILSAPRDAVMSDVNQMLAILLAFLTAFAVAGGVLIFKRSGEIHFEQHMKDQLDVERALNEANRELQIREDQDVKQDRLQTLGMLAGSMAHELNNAMTPIVIYSELLLDGYPNDPDIQEYAAQIHESAQRSGELVHNILTYGRQEKEEFEQQFYDVVPVFHATASMLRQIKPDNVEVQAICDISAAHLHGTAGSFRQVMVNLSTNAFHAMRENGGVLRLRLSKVGKDKILLEVDDTGHGMTPEVMSHIFKPFYTTKNEGEGTGLGLSIVKRLVQRQNGTITVEGQPGIGTRFRTTLPRYEFTGAPMNDEDVREISERPLRVFLVDDERVVLRALYESLAKTRWRLEAEMNSTRAYNKLHDHLEDWDLLITDVSMPEMNGVELAELLRARRSELKILLLTGYDDDPLEQYIQRGIADGFMYKPVETKQLLKKITEVIDSKKFTESS